LQHILKILVDMMVITLLMITVTIDVGWRFESQHIYYYNFTFIQMFKISLLKFLFHKQL
jgi:hypothetical protein